MKPLADLLEVPPQRRDGLKAIVDRLLAARHIVLTTHVNADADGAGSEAALLAWLEGRGIRVTILNPTPFPDDLKFILAREDAVVDADDPAADLALSDADIHLVVDTSEPNRITPLDTRLDPAKTFVVDHHPAGSSVLGQGGVQDPSAAATGELVWDMVTLSGDAWTPAIALGAYVAIVSDTGSFRFGNTSPRTHAIASQLLQVGISTEVVFRCLYAVASPRRLELLREALGTLEFDESLGLAWMVVPHDVADRLKASSEDFDGLIDQARSLRGTEIAAMFRELEPGEIKVSLRSSGDANVNRVARQFGGGGHVKASGISLSMPRDEAVAAVLAACREELGGKAD